MNTRSEFGPRPWMSKVLLLVAVYNIAWGAMVVLFPNHTLSWAGFATPVNYPQLWQCIGLIVGVYGVGFAIAATDPFRHWPIILVGALGKLFGPMGFLTALLAGTLPASMGWIILFNDLIWWGPFAVILWGAFRFHQMTIHRYKVDILEDDPVHELKSSHGASLHDLSMMRPQLVIFLRHAGCTFCREALSDLGQQRASIEAAGAGIVLVHLGSDDDADAILQKYGLDDLPRISDPECRLYQQFGLEVGNFRQLFGLDVWRRGIAAGLLNGHGVGPISGNPLQMPGAFVIHDGRFLNGFQHETAADRPDYFAFVDEALDSQPPVPATA